MKFCLGFLTCLVMFMAYACATGPGVTVQAGKVMLDETKPERIWPFTDDAKNYARKIMTAKGYIYDEPEDNFWLDITLGIGIAFGGLLIAGGIILAVFSKGIYLKEGIMALCSGLGIMTINYVLQEYIWIMASIAGVGLAGLLGFGIWYVCHNRETIFRCIKTVEHAKAIHPDDTAENAAKEIYRKAQGSYQKRIKRFQDTLANV